MNLLHLTHTLLVAVTFFSVCTTAPTLPTLYEYYTSGGIHSGLNASSDQFTLNGKPYVIFSGTFHYFRVVPERWRATLQRMKAAGLNAVQTYVAWNEHEDIPGHFDFKSPRLNLERFIEEVKAADLFLLIRPGPYICAERELGGFPSWLLRDPHLKLRSNNKTYLAAVKKYWDHVMTIVNRHQFTASGGPIIALQIENEYGGWLSSKNHDGYDYLHFLLNETRHSGFKELVYMSDNINITAQWDPARWTAPEILETANGHGEYTDLYAKMMKMRQNQPHRPVFDSEYWASWFDSWGSPHNRMSLEHFTHQVSEVLFRVNGSLNFFPFIGGTNFGFSNGANTVRVITSYDFDAPLTESGNYTEKYYETRKLSEQLMSTGRMPKIALPEVPQVQKTHAYGRVKVESYYPLEKLLEKSTHFTNVHKPVSMELLNLGPGYGQRYGFVLYRAVVPMPVATYEITGPIADRGIFLIDGSPITNILDAKNFITETLPSQYSTHHALDGHHLDLLVENMGRSDWGVSDRKGILSGDIILDGQIAHSLSIYSLDFNSTFLEQVTKSAGSAPVSLTHTPALYIAHLQVVGEPQDTYIQLKDWTKGVVFVNGFNLGRYWVIGPQKALYLPAPLLKTGQNQIAIFELHQAGDSVELLDHMLWG